MGLPAPLPSAANCLTPAIDSLVGNPVAQPTGVANAARLDHINYGVGKWSDVLAGWQAQANLNLRRVADEMLQARLPLASGLGLRELGESKYLTKIVDVPTKAIGTIVLSYAGSGGAGGRIPAGTRFRRNANPAAIPVPIQAADFISPLDVIVPNGTTGGTLFNVPMQCVTTGTSGNIPFEQTTPPSQPGSDLKIVDSLFQPFTVSSATAAGGGTGFTDVEVQRILRAQPQGRRGPTEGAIYAGSYLATGVRHTAVFEDLTKANTVVYLADESWASDTNYWQPAVLQLLAGSRNFDGWQGFGCSLNAAGAGQVKNYYLNVAATVQLRSNTLLQSTAGVQAAIVKALQGYFNDRDDWWTFKQAAIRALVARCDPRIMTCTNVAITDRFGASLQDPGPVVAPFPAALTHYAFLSSTPTFQPPS